MKRRLTVVFVLVFAAIAGTTVWASGYTPFWKTPQSVVTHPWFITTMVDTYLAFFTFWLWVAYKETSNVVRLVWLILVFALGNMAMAAYVLIQLARLPTDAGIEALLLRRR